MSLGNKRALLKSAMSTDTPVVESSRPIPEDKPTSSSAADDSAALVEGTFFDRFASVELLSQLGTERSDLLVTPDDTSSANLRPTLRQWCSRLVSPVANRHSVTCSCIDAISSMPPEVAPTTATYQAAQSAAALHTTAAGTSWRGAGSADSQAWMAWLAGHLGDAANLNASLLTVPLCNALLGSLDHAYFNEMVTLRPTDFPANTLANVRAGVIGISSSAFDVAYVTPQQFASISMGNVPLPAGWESATYMPFPEQFDATNGLVTAWVHGVSSPTSPRTFLTPAAGEPVITLNHLTYHAEPTHVVLVSLSQFGHGVNNLLDAAFVPRNIPMDSALPTDYVAVLRYLELYSLFREKVGAALLAGSVGFVTSNWPCANFLRVMLPKPTQLFARLPPVQVVTCNFDSHHLNPMSAVLGCKLFNFGVELAGLKVHAGSNTLLFSASTDNQQDIADEFATMFSVIFGRFGFCSPDVTDQGLASHTWFIQSPLSWFADSPLPIGDPEFVSLQRTRDAMLAGPNQVAFLRGPRTENQLDRATQRAFDWAAVGQIVAGALTVCPVLMWNGAAYAADVPVHWETTNAAGVLNAAGDMNPRPACVPVCSTNPLVEEQWADYGREVYIRMPLVTYNATFTSSPVGSNGTPVSEVVVRKMHYDGARPSSTSRRMRSFLKF